MLIDRPGGFLVTRDSSRTYTGINTDERFKKTFRVSEATFTFIHGGIQYDLQRDTVIIIIVIFIIIIIVVVIIIDKIYTFRCSLINIIIHSKYSPILIG